jgi:hypothetical protein
MNFFAILKIFCESPQKSLAAFSGVTAVDGIIDVVGVTVVAGATAVAGVTDAAGIICGYWLTLFYQDMPAVAGTLRLQTSVIFVLFLLMLPTLLLQGLCCCWRPWSPAAVFFLAVDCFAITGTSTDDAFLVAVLLIMTFLLLLS